MRSAVTLLASIPSPSSGTLDLGPVTIHMYGLMLLAGIAACIFITGRRWVARGGDWDLIFRVAVWGVGAGIVGARLYHLATSWSEVPDDWWGPFAVWKGGLGIWGGIAGGVLVGGIVAKRAGASVTALLDAARPASSSRRRSGGSATGGTRSSSASRPTVPGGSRSMPRAGPTSTSSTRPSTRRSSTRRSGTSPPRGLLLLDRASASARRRSSRSTSPLYTGFRFYLETIRIDPSEEIAGLRVNAWVSLILFVASTAFFVYWQFFRGRRDQPSRGAAAARGAEAGDGRPARARPTRR